MKVTKDTVTISDLAIGNWYGSKGYTVQLKDADPNELELFIQKLPASIKEKMQDLREANSTSRTSELETGQLRDFQPREENFQRQLRYVQQREENLQRQFRELQEREQSSQRQLTESRQREQNLKRQQMKFSDPRGDKKKESAKFQEQLNVKVQELTDLRKELRDREQDNVVLEKDLFTAKEKLTEYESQLKARDWVLCRDDVQLSDESLGAGALGRVVKGRYCGCVVAIKQLHQLTLTQRERRLFEREMDIASRCRHPCLLQFIGATQDERPLFVTEIMEKSLRKLLGERQKQNQHLTETEIIFISLDVARALNYLHQRKPEPIVHRDVSSANVLLWKQNNQWRGKLGDYGTAKFLQETMTVAPGAMIYAAPEIGCPFKQTVKVSLLYGISW
ncbi:unnamed protein product [Porites lobata]|uniref:Protein kinase domain-containing protein n=1 Tax=Porites lobata TaxID=104759 RepID=A0ABN8R4B6_9CNID|nr:unnamed protein product [Porites lobata]